MAYPPAAEKSLRAIRIPILNFNPVGNKQEFANRVEVVIPEFRVRPMRSGVTADARLLPYLSRDRQGLVRVPEFPRSADDLALHDQTEQGRREAQEGQGQHRDAAHGRLHSIHLSKYMHTTRNERSETDNSENGFVSRVS